MNYYNRSTRRHDETVAEVADNMLMDARQGDVSVNLWEMVRDWVLDRPEGDVEVTVSNDVIVSIPSTYPDLFGNGSTIDRANRKAIEEGHLGGEMTAYVQDHPATGGPLALNVSDLLCDGEGAGMDRDDIQNALNIIDGLGDYPVLDDDIWTGIEDDENHENWVDYGARDIGILRDGETFKDGDGSIPLAILCGHWIDRTEDLLIVEHTGHDTSFVIDPEDVEKAREAVAEYIVTDA